MKIIYISKYASYPPYGFETRQVYFSKSLVKRGVEVKLLISKSNHILFKSVAIDNEVLDGVNIEWLDTLSYKKPYGVARILSWFHFEFVLRNRLRKEKLTSDDVVIVSSLSLLSIWNGIYLKRKFNCKLVLEVRDIWPAVMERIGKVRPSHLFYHFLSSIELKGYQQADSIIGTMPNLKEHVCKRLTHDKEVLWIPHLINPAVKYKITHNYAKELGSIKENRDSVLVGYAGSINRSSALQFFLDAAISFSNKDVHFLILGEGPLRDQFRREYSSANIHFFSKLSQEEVVPFLKDCDILYDGYLKADIYKYGSSRNKYVEYVSAQRPMLVSYDGYPLFVDTYKCGITVEPESVKAIEDGLEYLLQNKEKWTIMAAGAVKMANENLGIESQVDKLLLVLQSDK
jgi:glycosyltransferase involved in cell wall biosynthesis